MLHILFSPSEAKRLTCKGRKLSELLFGLEKREKILKTYNAVALSNDIETKQKLFGLKREEDIARFSFDIFDTFTCKAIELYVGVAYEYLDFASLPSDARRHISKRTLIFSNLYGSVRADDDIAPYKVKQGERIGDIASERFYKEHFSEQLDDYLQNGEILDLRAGYYDKFYKVRAPYTTMKFYKNGKVVSHYAKAYRGLVLRAIAQSKIDSIDALSQLPIEGLHVKDIKTIKQKREIAYDIIAP